MALIVDLGLLSGAYAARLLAEAGHDVIRIDAPAGDAIRRSGPFLGDTPHLENGCYHRFLNQGKRSLSLNLQSSAGRQVFMDLIKKADGVIVSQPMPVGEEALLDAKPSLVLTRVEEEEVELCGYARSGLLSLTGHPDGCPTVLGGHMIYSATGTYVALGTAAALYVLQRSGRGQIIEISMRDCLETFVEQAMVEYTFSGTHTERRGSRGSITAISGALPCKDGYWVISQINRPGRWEQFMEWVQDPALGDPSLAQDEVQQTQRDFIMDRILAWANRFTKQELVEEGQKRHFPASPVSTPSDLVRDPQLVARGFVEEIDLPGFGRVMLPRGAIATVRGQSLVPAPSMGQHNAEVLAELGYSRQEYETLMELGAV